MTEATPQEQSLPRHALLAALAAIALTGTRFVLSAVAARKLSQADFGQFAYVVWLIDIAFLVCSLGATGAVGRYAAEFRSDVPRLAAFMHRWRRWAIGLPLLAGIAALLGAWLSRLPLDSVSCVLVSIWAVAQARWALQTAALTGSQRFDIILLASLLAGAIMVSGIVFLPIDAYGLPLLFALMAISATVGASTGSAQVRRLGAGAVVALDPQRWRLIRTYALNIWLTALLWALVWSRGEFPIVRAFVGDEGVAAYAAAMTLFGGAVQAVMLGVSGVAPQLTRLWGEDRKQQALEIARKVMDLQLLACGVAALVLICFGPELMSLAFGDRYRTGAGALAILGIGLVSMTLSSQNHVLQIATDARFNRDTSLLGLAALMLLAFAFTPSLAVEGAALARASTMILLAAVSVFVVRRRWSGAAVSLQSLLATSAVCLAAGLVAYAIDGQYPVARGAVFLAGVSVLALALRAGDGSLIVMSVFRWLVSSPRSRLETR